MRIAWTRVYTHAHTFAQRSGQPGPDTQKHHQLYRGRRLDYYHYHCRYHHYVERHHPRNTWRRLYAEYTGRGRGSGGRRGGDGKRGRFFKSSHQGSILAWLNARAPHIESDLPRPRVFVGRPLSSSKFNYRYERETYFCVGSTSIASCVLGQSCSFLFPLY